VRFENHASQFTTQHTEEEKAQFSKEFEAITTQMHDAQKAGLSPHSSEVQEMVKAHYEFVSKFWTPNKSAYKSLALMYILPSEYRDYYENVEEELSKFTYEAVCIWADKNLAD
jgi:hypothetical protein